MIKEERLPVEDLKCPLKCGKVLTRNLIDEHLKNICIKRVLIDKSTFFCKLDYSILTKSSFDTHIKLCKLCAENKKIEEDKILEKKYLLNKPTYNLDNLENTKNFNTKSLNYENDLNDDSKFSSTKSTSHSKKTNYQIQEDTDRFYCLNIKYNNKLRMKYNTQNVFINKRSSNINDTMCGDSSDKKEWKLSSNLNLNNLNDTMRQTDTSYENYRTRIDLSEKHNEYMNEELSNTSHLNSYYEDFEKHKIKETEDFSEYYIQ